MKVQRDKELRVLQKALTFQNIGIKMQRKPFDCINLKNCYDLNITTDQMCVC